AIRGPLRRWPWSSGSRRWLPPGFPRDARRGSIRPSRCAPSDWRAPNTDVIRAVRRIMEHVLVKLTNAMLKLTTVSLIALLSLSPLQTQTDEIAALRK